VYPSDNQVITSRDSNFVLGSVGSGDATLSINGNAVPVAPNGAFLAWLPNPQGTSPQYQIVARRGVDSVARTLAVRFPAPRPALQPVGRLRVDSATLSPGASARLRLRSNEAVRVSIRAPSNARAYIEGNAGTFRHPLVIASETQRTTLNAAQGVRTPIATDMTNIVGADVATTFITEIAAARLAAGARLVVVRDADTVRLPLAAPVLADTGITLTGVLRSASTVASDTDRVVIGRPIPDGTYKWLLLSGTMVEITGVQGAFTRVRLDDQLEVWVSNDDIVALPAGTPLPRRVTGGFRVIPAAEWVDVNISTGDRPAYYIEPDGRTLTLTLYRTQANPEISPIIGNDSLVRRIAWEQVSTDRVRLTFTLSQPVFGWLVLWDEPRRTFVLRLRRAPLVNTARPLSGLTIAVDAGHPPAGSTGPTGLYEGDAVLPVAEKLAQLLRERGATPVMTRTTRGALGLVERTMISRRANAHAFVSIHLNALPDGVNPFTNNGTSTLFFHQHSEPLARTTQTAMMKRFPLRDLGVHYQNLAIARPTWYPSILAEGLFVMLPEQEAAMRNEAFQMRYAEALVEGLERYFAQLGRQ
jgi:N-acetylmuramoyl-L-alanine amidase